MHSQSDGIGFIHDVSDSIVNDLDFLNILELVAVKHKHDASVIKSPEKVELSFVSDDTLQFVHRSAESQEQFQVQQEKKKTSKKNDSLNRSGGAIVFTGMSPIKPKLRSTMNELMSRPTLDNVLLPRIEYGLETLVKLPWPNDGSEDAAWVSGHHFCLTVPMELNVNSFCFLCGSAGKEKVSFINSSHC